MDLKEAKSLLGLCEKIWVENHYKGFETYNWGFGEILVARGSIYTDSDTGKKSYHIEIYKLDDDDAVLAAVAEYNRLMQVAIDKSKNTMIDKQRVPEGYVWYKDVPSTRPVFDARTIARFEGDEAKELING